MNLPKLILSSSVVVFALCAPAVAAVPAPPPTAAPPAPPSPRPARTATFAIEVKTGPIAAHYDVVVDTEQCGRVEDFATDHVEIVKLCVVDSARGLDVRIEWESRRGDAKYITQASSLIAAGKPLTLGRDGGPRLALTLR